MDFTPFERDGLVHARDVVRVDVAHRELVRAVARGVLVRLRQGVYIRRELWLTSSSLEQHLFRIRAASTAATHPLVFARESAAALWGIPLVEFPKEVVVLEQWKGGGRSEPGVRRTARGALTATSIMHDGFTSTTLARTVLDITRSLPFQKAVPILDWTLSATSPSAIAKADLLAEAELVKCSPAGWRAIDFSTPLSGSWGESDCRAAIHLLGYPTPQLQYRFVDSQGEMFTDFYFDRDDAAAEFDGKVKYTLDKYTKGDPAEVVWREKKREDRLRRQVRTVIRIVTEDVRDPRLLDQKLREAGVRRLGGSNGLLA